MEGRDWVWKRCMEIGDEEMKGKGQVEMWRKVGYVGECMGGGA